MDDGPLLSRHNFYSDYNQSNPRHLTSHQQDLLAHLDRLKFFLATAPSRWSAPDAAPNSQHHPALNRFLLPSGEYVTCVLWSGLYHITGTDIVRALVFRFEAFGRPVRNMKKFEEGVFSDLRNLKPGHDACLEEPKSPFLDLLFKYQCIRTQKKQKVFYWFSVPHDRLFLDALERDLKREKMGLESTTTVVAEPAASFVYDPKRSLYEQFAAATKPATLLDSEGTLSRAVRQVQAEASASTVSLPELDYPSASSSIDGASIVHEPPTPPAPVSDPASRPNPLARSPFFNMFALFEGSPNYKQRRKKIPKVRKGANDEPDKPRPHSFFGGSGQLGLGPLGTGFPPSEHVSRLAQQMRAQLTSAREEPSMEIDQAESAHTSPETPPFPHVLTTPDGSPGYEDEHAYHHSVNWTSESSAYSTASGQQQQQQQQQGAYVSGYAYDHSPAGSSDVLPAPSVPSTSQPYYTLEHTYPVSAPAHRVTFDHVYPGLSADLAAPYPVRRPRSVTPSLPEPAGRPAHVRRPSTANEVPTTFGASGSQRTFEPRPTPWRYHTMHAHTRGYHPYAPAAPTDAHSYSTGSSHSSPGTSPFAITLNTPAGEYSPEVQAHEYAESQPSPHLPDQFAHMVALEGATTASPVGGLQLSYPTENEAYDESSAYAQRGSPESSTVEHEYEYAEYASHSSAGSSEHVGIYQMAPPQDTQSHHPYYPQQVV